MISPVDDKLDPRSRQAILSDIENVLDIMSKILRTRGLDEILSKSDVDNLTIIRNTLEDILRHRGE